MRKMRERKEGVRRQVYDGGGGFLLQRLLWRCRQG